MKIFTRYFTKKCFIKYVIHKEGSKKIPLKQRNVGILCIMFVIKKM